MEYSLTPPGSKESQVSFQYSPSQISQSRGERIDNTSPPTHYHLPGKTPGSGSGRSSDVLNTHYTSYEPRNNEGTVQVTGQSERLPVSTGNASKTAASRSQTGSSSVTSRKRCRSPQSLENRSHPDEKQQLTRSSSVKNTFCTAEQILRRPELSIFHVVGFIHSVMRLKPGTERRVEKGLDVKKSPGQCREDSLCLYFLPFQQLSNTVTILLWQENTSQVVFEYLHSLGAYARRNESHSRGFQQVAEADFRPVRFLNLQLRYSSLLYCWTLQSTKNTTIEEMHKDEAKFKRTQSSDGNTFSFSAVQNVSQALDFGGDISTHDFINIPESKMCAWGKIVGIEPLYCQGDRNNNVVDSSIRALSPSSPKWKDLLEPFAMKCCSSCFREMKKDSSGGLLCQYNCSLPSKKSLQEWTTKGSRVFDYFCWLQCMGEEVESEWCKLQKSCSISRYRDAKIYVELSEGSSSLPLLVNSTIVQSIFGGVSASHLLESLISDTTIKKPKEQTVRSLASLLDNPFENWDTARSICKFRMEYVSDPSSQLRWKLLELVPTVRWTTDVV